MSRSNKSNGKRNTEPTVERMDANLRSARSASVEPRPSADDEEVLDSRPPVLPTYARKWVPDYTRIVAQLVCQVFLGFAAMIKGILGLKWYHVVFPPWGIMYFASLWLAGFVNIPDQVERTNFDEDWLSRYVKLVKLPNAKYNPNTEKKGMWWIPKTDLRWAMTHGIMVSGLSHLQMFGMVALFFPQLMLGSLWRCLQFRFRFGAWKPNKADPAQTYLAILNTSLATYYNAEEDAFIYYDIIILADYNQGQRKFSSIKIKCDHDVGTVVSMEMNVAADPVFGIKRDRIVLDAIRNTVSSESGKIESRQGAKEEIAMLVVQIGALMTHPQVHWWANGVAEVSQWKLYKKSNVWVQFLNYLSCFQSLFFYHAPFANDTDLLAKNLVNGMPMHSNMPEKVSQWSVMHKMTYEARGLLKKHFASVGKPISDDQLNSLMCATIYHAADHHYLNKYSCRNGLCDILQTDFRVMRICIVAGYRWIGTKFLCKQYYNEDPVCKILYDTALKHDPEFANGLLTIGIAI